MASGLYLHLPRSARDPEDVESRLQCMIGTWLSIFALPEVGVGLSHGIGHQLAAEFDMLHGVTSAVMLPGVMEFGSEFSRPQLRAIAEAMGADTARMSDKEAIDRAVKAVRGLIRSSGVPYRLRDLQLDGSQLENIATNAMKGQSVTVNSATRCPRGHPHPASAGLVMVARLASAAAAHDPSTSWPFFGVDENSCEDHVTQAVGQLAGRPPGARREPRMHGVVHPEDRVGCHHVWLVEDTGLGAFAEHGREEVLVRRAQLV